MFKNTNKEIGDLGEKIAGKYLISKGYEIVGQNIRWKKYEIDLIIKKDDWLIFVEVKTRKMGAYIPAIESINKNKLQAMSNFADNYIKEIDWNGNIRFDAVIISYSYLTPPIIKHIENLSIE
ncbi:MAG: YraN family protein [Bacteroidales bacterium]|jgi:putative endonuclease|nr:YraN family protein [Bacteroidales bacterium]MDI9576359.1 YraN family protein [Bacteroidota bacterium]MDD3755118.1 YraN family protein [Bacteroidales bacterium]MDY0400634.1 YraN family protein [Bacteroidales bacterium]HHW59738.1 YraN family protein [Bacteroidales bacterium]